MPQSRCLSVVPREGEIRKNDKTNASYETTDVSKRRTAAEERRILTHLCQVDSPTFTLQKGPFPIEGVSGNFLLLHVPCFIETHVCNANSVDPDQTPRSAASDLGLYCLPMSLLWDARNKWVNQIHDSIDNFLPSYFSLGAAH